MKNILSLYHVLTRNAEMRVPTKGERGRMYISIGIIAVACIMLPCCFIVGFISYMMTEALKIAGNPGAGILAELHIMSAFSVVFGMLVVFAILFFSSDREHMMPLPFKSYELFLAKFLFAFMAESVMEFLILASMFIGFHISYGFSVTGVLTGIVGTFLIPMVPMAYCAIIGLILLVVLRNVKNGNIFNYVSTVTLILFTLLFLYSFKDFGSISVENYVTSLSDNSNMFTNVLNKVFFTVPLLTNTLAEGGNLLYLIVYILASLGVVGIMTLLSHFTYREALYTIGRLGSGKKKTDIRKLSETQRSVVSSYFKKELLVLLRTKAYANNCVYINLLWPVLLVAFILYYRDSENFIHFQNLFAGYSYPRAYMIMTIVMVLLAFIASAMNSLASTSITREGLHYDLIKYIPVPYSTQIYVKGLVAMVLAFPPLLLCDIILVVTFRMDLVWIIYYAFITFGSLIATTMMGLILDTSHPHSDWDDEYSALRGNLNTFFNMALIMVVSLLVCAIGFMLDYFLGIGIVAFHLYMMIMVGIMAAASYLYGAPKTLKNLEELE